MNTYDAQICVTLRNFESDSEYLHFGDFWIQKLTEEDRGTLLKNLKHFTNYPEDNYLLGYRHYLGRGEGPEDALFRQSRNFLFPLFRTMKLFKSGDLIMPLCFVVSTENKHDTMQKKYDDMQLQGEYYGLGYGLEGDPYIFNRKEIKVFKIFKKEIKKYLKYMNFFDIPYLQKPEILKNIDDRCILAIRLFLKRNIENDVFSIIEKLLDYTIGLESLYLSGERNKRDLLSKRISALLSKDESEKNQILNEIKEFYEIRNDIVHGSFLDKKNFEFLRKNIYKYGDYLRKSILAFLDLNLRNPSKKVVLRILDKAILDFDLRKEIKESLNILKLAK